MDDSGEPDGEHGHPGFEAGLDQGVKGPVPVVVVKVAEEALAGGQGPPGSHVQSEAQVVLRDPPVTSLHLLVPEIE